MSKQPSWAWGLVGLLALGLMLTVEEEPMFGETTQPGPHFTWRELTRSVTAERLGLRQEPSDAQRARLRHTVSQLEVVRAAIGKPVRITSGWRSRDLNMAVGGSPTSQHVTGEAVDIKVDGMTAEHLARAIIRSGVEYDQLIGYVPELGGHVHVSFVADGRGRLLTQWSPRRKVYETWRLS